MQATTNADVSLRATQSRRLAPDSVKLLASMSDVLAIFVPCLAVYLAYVGAEASTLLLYVGSTFAICGATLFTFYITNLYTLDCLASPLSHVRRLVPVMVFVLLAYTGFLFALKASDQLSRVWVFASFVGSASLVMTGRIALSQFIGRAARARAIGRNVVVVGGGPRGEQLIGYLQSRNDPLTNVVGVFDDRMERIPREVGGLPVLGNLNDLLQYARANRCDEILVALPGEAHARIMDIVNELRVLPVNVSLCPDFAGLKFLPTSYRDCSGVPVLAMARKPFTDIQALVKRAEDLILGSLITLCALPVMAVIAVLIKLDSRGPVLFRQPRYGFNNKLVNVYKFRTMYQDRSDAAGSVLTQKNDPRITRIGGFLRRSSLDELPQFFNVLKGEMSIVGPRPHAVQAKAGSKLYEDVVTAYAARHRVKPGITGWAQVNGWRGETSTDEHILERVNHDLHYIDNWSVFFDLWIILRTFFAVATTDKAF